MENIHFDIGCKELKDPIKEFNTMQKKIFLFDSRTKRKGGG